MVLPYREIFAYEIIAIQNNEDNSDYEIPEVKDTLKDPG
jgi:hypothetical protein